MPFLSHLSPMRILLAGFFILGLTACVTPSSLDISPGTPSAGETLSAPTLAAEAGDALIAELLSRTPESALSTATPAGPTFTPTVTRWATTQPFGTAIRPEAAQLLRPLELSPDEAHADWRPPPLPVPLSIHPDDHYWFIRPIPSGKRNYDLEWYPFGNDVLAHSLEPYRIHHGLDFPNETGTPILAAGSGTVIHAGPLISNRDGFNYYGNTVIVEHDWQWLGEPVYTLYAHALELFVVVGDVVEQGQLLAGVGASGEVSGPHLHFEVRVGNNNYYHVRNPMLWIAPYEGWGTLAGRLVDRRGRYITNAEVKVTPLDVPGRVRTQHTYLYDGVKPDDVWRENFVFGDTPAGRYRVELNVGGIEYRHFIDVLPGRTNFLTIGTNFDFVPTATPTPTLVPIITATYTLTTTIPADFTPTVPPEGGN